MALAANMLNKLTGQLTQPGTTNPAVKPLTPGAPNDINPSMPNTATGLTTLSDGQGGAVPVPPTSLAPPSVTTPMTAFSPDSNLINQQINPTATPRLVNTQGMTDQALSSVLNGPDRVQLGQQYYDTFSQRAQANLGRGIQDATNAAAAHGQIGSGMLTNRYGDLMERFNLDNTTAASDFATRALEGTIGDRLNNLNAARGVESSIYGQNANDRAELRGERGYQSDLAQQAIARRIQQEQMEMAQQNQSFNQGLDLYGLGVRPDPTGAYQTAAGMSSAEAGSNSADVGALLRFLAQNRTPYPTGGY